MKEFPDDVENLAADALHDAEAGAPLLGDYSQDDLSGDGAVRLTDSTDHLASR